MRGFQLLTIIVLLTSCIEREDAVEINEVFTRAVGPEGGTIVLYEEGLPGEWGGTEFYNTTPVAILEFPPGAVSEEVAISVRKRNQYPDEFTDEVWQFFPADIQFQQPVKLTYRFATDSLNIDWFCFGAPLSIPVDGNLTAELFEPTSWQPISEYEIDKKNLRVSTFINNFSHVYGFGLFEEPADRYFCSQSNNLMEVPLGNDDGNVMVLRDESLPVPSFLHFENHTFPKGNSVLPRIGDYYILNNLGNPHKKVIPAYPLSEEGIVFLDLSGAQVNNTWLNWGETRDKVVILRLNEAGTDIEEVLQPNPLYRDDAYFLYGTGIQSTGFYVAALPVADFSLWLGGKITIVAEGGSTDTTLVFENYDYGGAIEDFVSTVSYLNMATGKDQSQGYISFSAWDLQEGSRSFPNFLDSFFIRYYTEGGEARFFEISEFGANIQVTQFGGQDPLLIGTIVTNENSGGVNHLGETVNLHITFELRLSLWEE